MNPVDWIVGCEPSRPLVTQERGTMRSTPRKSVPNQDVSTAPRKRKTLQALGALVVAGGLCGCQGLGVPLAQWRSGYDSGLAKKLSKDEIASSSSNKLSDSDTLLKRWLQPIGARGISGPAEGDDEKRNASTLVLGSNGWKPFSKPELNPEAQKELVRPSFCQAR